MRFTVSRNSLSGHVPEGLWALPNIIYVNLEENQFIGGIGSGIRNAASLSILILAGTIPSAIGNTTGIVSINQDSTILYQEPRTSSNLNETLPPFFPL